MIERLRTQLVKEFELESGNDTEVHEIGHFGVKLLRSCVLLALEAWLITLLYYYVQSRLSKPIGRELSLTELFFVSTILAIGINVATAKIIYKIQKDQHHKNN